MAGSAGAAAPASGVPAANPPAADRRARAALLALLLVALGLRLWFLSGDLSGKRFFDERFSLRNVAVLLQPEKGERLNAFYPSLSFLPQTAALAASDGLHRLTGARVFRVIAGAGYTPTAYFLVRAVSAAFGLASLVLLYLVGRRMFSPAVGLLAALLFGAMPRHVYASSIFKPDVLVVLLVLLTFWWSLDAQETGRRRRFWLAGFGFGLAMAAKYTGIAALGPLVVAALAGHWRDARRWRWLLEAGGVSLLVFLVLNPYIAVVLRFLPRLWRIGQDKGTEAGVTAGAAARAELDFLLVNLTPLVVLASAAGAVGLGWAAWRRRAGVPRTPVAMALTLVVSYSLLWVALRFFRGLYYLPVAAFASLFAAWALAVAGGWLLRRLPARAAPAAAWAVGLALAAVVLAHPFTWVYRQRVPTTWSAAGSRLATLVPRPFERRSALVEVGTGGVPFRVAPRGFLQRRVRSLRDEPPSADAEVFAAARLEGAGGEPYRRRLAEPGIVERRVARAAFRARGPEVVLLVRRWAEGGRLEPAPRAAGEPARRLVFELAAPSRPGDHASVEARVPARPDGRGPTELLVDGRRVALHTVAVRPRRVVLRTARFALAPDTARLVITLPRQAGWPGSGHEVSLTRWRLAAPAAREAGPSGG